MDDSSDHKTKDITGIFFENPKNAKWVIWSNITLSSTVPGRNSHCHFPYLYLDPHQNNNLMKAFHWICSILTLRSVTAARLVIFAGPRKTSETSVEEFFFSYAHGPGSATVEFPHQQALKHWIWPQIHSVTGLSTTPHQIFKHLVTDASNSNMQAKILGELKDNFERAKLADGDSFQGMIIGSEDFDRVGPNPYLEDDALDAVRRVVDELGLLPSSVTIVLLYRYPRLKQWLGIVNFVPTTTQDGAYQQLLCRDEYSETFAWDALQNSMNPLRVAKAYADEGYDVRVFDMAGIESQGLDVEHVIGCTVLNAECDQNGYLINLSDESYLKDSEVMDSMLTEFPELTLQQEADLEKLFLLRDCAYDSLRTDDGSGISLEFQQGLLPNECSDTDKSMGTLISDTDYFLNVIQSQVDCNPDPVSIKAIFDGTVSVPTIPPTPSPTVRMTDPPTMSNTVSQFTQSPTRAPIDDTALEFDSTVSLPQDGEGTMPPVDTDTGIDTPAPESVASQQSQTMTASDDDDPHWKIPVFLLVFIGVGGVALFWTRQNRRRRNRMESPDLELQPSLVEPTQDWTKTFD